MFRSARRHKIGKGHAIHVMEAMEPSLVPATEVSDARPPWLGKDDRGIELEIAALILTDEIVVIHVMPTSLRRR